MLLDPWDNAPSKFLNNYYGRITKKYIEPLILEASKKGFTIYIFTNNCASIKPIPYSCGIPKTLLAIEKKYPNVHLQYWQNIKASQFERSLKKNGFSKLIYLGYASNFCIIGRPLGLVAMDVKGGFSLYFIPKASAAVEAPHDWKSKTLHKATTIIISQWMAKIIKYSDIYAALEKLPNVSQLSSIKQKK